MSYFAIAMIFAVLTAGVNFVIGYCNNQDKGSNIVWSLVFGAVLGGVFHFLMWGTQPTMSFGTSAIYWYITAWIVLIGIRTIADEDSFDSSVGWWVIGTGLVYLLVFAIVGIAGSGIFHAHQKQQMLKVEVVETSQLDDYVAATDVHNMCTVSEKVAMRSILTAMGDYKNTYERDCITKQSVTCDFEATLVDGSKVRVNFKDHIVYVVTFKHRSYWTERKLGYVPIYAIADASNEDVFYVITEVNGEPLRIIYTEGSRLGRYLPRHMRNHGYANVILDDFNVEIDENGRPWAPVTTLENSILLGTRRVTGVALVDIQNGDINWYSPQEAPSFVNMVYPESLVYDYLTWWGDYIYGYFHFSEKTGLVQPCEGMDVIQTQNGCYYYVGIQAQTDSVGTQGYMLINTRTGEANYFRRNGISEQEGARVLESNTDLNLEMNSGVLELTEPIFYNVEGIGTYFATYVSTKDYMVKYYGFCSTTDKSVWGYGTTLEQAKASYMASYYKESMKSNKLNTSSEMQLVVLEAKVLEKVQEGTAYYLRLEGQGEKVYFVGYSEVLPEIRWSAKKVKVSYNPTESNQIALSTYEILER